MSSKGGDPLGGISPALLQAIQQTLAPADNGSENGNTVKSFTDEHGQKIVFCNAQGQPLILRRAKEEEAESQGILVQTSDEERVLVTNSSADGGNYVVLQNEDRNVVVQLEGAGDQAGQQVMMGSVLSAIASRLKGDEPCAESEMDQHIVIYANAEGTEEMTVRSSEVVIPSDDKATTPAKKARCEAPDSIYLIRDDDVVAAAQTAAPASIVPTEWSAYVSQFVDKGPCPICGDRVSGYHYGIYCCESCKGFFKRTIQNKKSFVCHRSMDCEVSMNNRKKCPACRLRKCVDSGMKLEAVRDDRSRGGRSMYEGCSPRSKGKPDKPSPACSSRPAPPHKPAILRRDSGHGASRTSHLMAMLSQNESVRATVPQLVTDIMNLESLLGEDDDDDVGLDAEDNLYTALLQIADQRLYKIVRWARSLPDFAVVSTDDQIALLQNAWAELLCLDCCWRSLQTPNEIKLSYNKSIDCSAAQQLNADEIFQRVLQLRDHLQRVQLDMHEFACLKVLVLMSPDIKGLKDLARVRDYQEKVTDALCVYTSTHYPHCPNKFGDLLLRLSEIAKTSVLCKEMLSRKDLPAEVSSFSLLMELLKTNPSV